MSDTGTFVAVSSTSAKLCCLDRDGKPTHQWQETGQQPQGSVNWLRNGKAFLTTQGGSIAAHVIDNLKEKPPIILSLPSGPLLGRVSGDGKCLVLVQSGVPGIINVYDLPSLLGSASGTPAKPAFVLQDHDKPILAIAASSSTTHVASSNSLGAVYLHEACSGARSTLGSLPGGPMLMTPKRCLAFSQLNKPLRLAAGADDGQVLVWQISPMASGPIVMPNKLRGRVMGVGFAMYKKQPSSVLLACSETGQLILTDLRGFPNIQSQASISVELSVAVSCMMVRDDGQFVAVGTKDGRVGLIRVDDLINNGQNVTKLGCIKVFDLGTHLDVVDIAFQRVRENRESRDHSRESREATPAAPAPVPAAPAPAAPTPEPPASATQQAPPAEAADGRRGSGGVAELSAGELLEEEPPLKRHATYSVLMTAGSGSQRQGPPEKQDTQAARSAPTSSSSSSAAAAAAAAAGPVATGAPQRQQIMSTLNTTSTSGNTATRAATANTHPAASTSTGAAAATAAGVSGSAAGAPLPSGPSGFMQPPAARPAGVPPVVIPGIAPPVGPLRRQSELGGGHASSSSATPSGVQGTEEALGAEGNTQPPHAARVLLGGAAVASTCSPASSPRPRSPRATVSGGGYPPVRPYGGSSGGADLMSAAGLRSYMDDFRQEVRDLVRGLQADMVRQAVAAEMAHRNDIALLQQENRLLWEEVRRLSQQLDANLRFGLLSQQGAPWQ